MTDPNFQSHQALKAAAKLDCFVLLRHLGYIKIIEWKI